MTLERYAEADLPTAFGPFRLYVYRTTGKSPGGDTPVVEEHMAIVRGDLSHGANILCRVHSECWTSEVLGSLKCDCREQLDTALQTRKLIGQATGIVMQRYGLNEHRAFAYLVRVSSTSNTKLHDIAAHLVAEANAKDPAP